MTVTIPGATLTHAAAQRPALERFIAERFRQAYGAQVSHFCAHLLGLRERHGSRRRLLGPISAQLHAAPDVNPRLGCRKSYH